MKQLAHLKEILLEYTYKDLNAIFGKFFDNAFMKERYTFRSIYDNFEENLLEFKKKFRIQNVDVSWFIITNTYSKYKKYIEKRGEQGEKDRHLSIFLEHFPILVFLVSYFKKFQERFLKLKKNVEYIKISHLINTYESLSFENVLNYLNDPNIFQKYENIVTDYILPTYVDSTISPIYEDSEVTIYKPKNWVESRHLAADTEWCISSSDAKNQFNLYYKNDDYDIYFIFEKNKGVEGKWAFLLKRNIENLQSTFNKRFPPKPVFNEELIMKIFKMVKFDLFLSRLEKSYLNISRFSDSIFRLFSSGMKNKNEFHLQLEKGYFNPVYLNSLPDLPVPFEYVEKLIKGLRVDREYRLLLEIPFINMGSIVRSIFKNKHEKEKSLEAIKILFSLENGKHLLRFMNDYEYSKYLITNEYSSLEYSFDSELRSQFITFHKFIETGKQVKPFSHQESEFEVRDYQDNVVKIDNAILNLIKKIKGESGVVKFLEYYEKESKALDNYEKALDEVLRSMYKIDNAHLLKTIKFKSVNEIYEYEKLVKQAYYGDAYKDYSALTYIKTSYAKEYDNIMKEFEENFLMARSPEEFYFNIISYFLGDAISNTATVIVNGIIEHLPFSSISPEKVFQLLNAGKRSYQYFSIPWIKNLYDQIESELKKHFSFRGY